MKCTPHILIVLVFILGLFSSCEEETCCDKPVEATNFVPPTSGEFSTLQENALDSLAQTVRFNADLGLDFTSEKGAVLQISKNCFTLDGQVLFGELELEFIEIYDRSKMLAPNKPTMALLQNGIKTLLVSGGVFYINITKDGQQVGIQCEITLQVPAELTGGENLPMQLWKGTIDQNQNLLWQETPVGGVNFANGNYLTFFFDLGWTGIGKVYENPNPKTNIRVLVTEGYTAENSGVYLGYSGVENGLMQLQGFDPQTNMFLEASPEIPVGQEVHLIFVTEENGMWRYAIKTATISENEIYTIVHSETTVGNLQDLRNSILGLP